MSEAEFSLDSLSADAGEAHADEILVVDVDGYEGPLHLLLELARRQKVDVRQVSVLQLAEQYLTFIADARDRRIDLAADYLLMAAWLAFLKSRLLLPKPETPQDEAPDGDEMAAKLAFRLKRLEAMREAARTLMNGPRLGQRVFARGAPRQPHIVKRTEYDTTVWHITQAFGAIRGRHEQDAPHQIHAQYVLPRESARKSLRTLTPRLADWERLDSIRARLEGISCDLPVRSVTASVFSAALELARDGEVELRQEVHFHPLFLRGSQTAERETVHEAA